MIGLLPPTSCGLDQRCCLLLSCDVVGLVGLVGGGWWIEWRIQTENSVKASLSEFIFVALSSSRSQEKIDSEGLEKCLPKHLLR